MRKVAKPPRRKTKRGNSTRQQHQGAKLSMVFWSFRGGVDDEGLRNAFRQLAKAAGDMPLQTASGTRDKRGIA
jgi:hypothetical protein